MMSGLQACLQLQRMPQLAEAASHDDDWTGLTSLAARKKRQNRLNVRAFRRRKAEAALAKAREEVANADDEPHWVEERQAVIWLPRTRTQSSKAPLLPMKSKGLPEVILPLSSDHLITLLQYNTLRGSLTNRKILDQIPALNSKLHEAFPPTDLHIFPNLNPSTELAHLPPSLQPTLLQRTVRHEHWIDIVPHPVMRNNLIKAAGAFDPDQLWFDTVGGLYEGLPDSHVEQRGVVMWDPPWHFCGWEMSEGFVRNWAWALRGCEDWVVVTNSWRARRGQDPIVVEIP